MTGMIIRKRHLRPTSGRRYQYRKNLLFAGPDEWKDVLIAMDTRYIKRRCYSLVYFQWSE